MNNLRMIVAIGQNNEIGYQNDLIWKIKEDLQYFKEVTMGQNNTGSYLVVGENTYHSMPPVLPGRKYVVLTRSPEKLNIKDIIVSTSIPQALELVKNNPHITFNISGGHQIYKQFMPYVDKMLITEIEDTFKQADTFYPDFDKSKWNRIVDETHTTNNYLKATPHNGVKPQTDEITYHYTTYTRKRI